MKFALAAACIAAAYIAAGVEYPPFSPELKRFTSEGFTILLPARFLDSSEQTSRIEDANRDNHVWLWGHAVWDNGPFTREQLEEFSAGVNCPADKGQKVFHRKAVRTKTFTGVRLSCGDPKGKPYVAGTHVSGWTELRANSKRSSRRYVIHLDYWEDPRKESVQELIDRIVLSVKERGSAGLKPRAKRRRVISSSHPALR